ncbi:hypothetical protein GQR58_010457 [Nymphon striatum]|nr:hypothetical protein GQR58_010457 [Nymphon striatum]
MAEASIDSSDEDIFQNYAGKKGTKPYRFEPKRRRLNVDQPGNVGSRVAPLTYLRIFDTGEVFPRFLQVKFKWQQIRLVNRMSVNPNVGFVKNVFKIPTKLYNKLVVQQEAFAGYLEFRRGNRWGVTSNQNVLLMAQNHFGQYYINVDCKSISNVEETLKSLGDIAKSPLELKITDYPLKRIPSHFLDGISVGSLMIRNTKLEEIDDEAFTSLQNTIFSLEIMNTSLKSLSASSMKNLSTLEVLIISEDGNLQNSITADDTKDLPSTISSFDITYTSLKIIGNNAFSNMKILRYLSLSRNKLTSLPDNAFPMKLETLDLSLKEKDEREKGNYCDGSGMLYHYKTFDQLLSYFCSDHIDVFRGAESGRQDDTKVFESGTYQFQSVSGNSLGAVVKETKLDRGGDGGGGGGGGCMKLKNLLEEKLAYCVLCNHFRRLNTLIGFPDPENMDIENTFTLFAHFLSPLVRSFCTSDEAAQPVVRQNNLSDRNCPEMG